MYTQCDSAAFANFVAAISHTNSNWFEFVRLIAATKFCCSDNDFHKINRVTQGELLRRLVPATCGSDLSPSMSWPLGQLLLDFCVNEAWRYCVLCTVHDFAFKQEQSLVHILDCRSINHARCGHQGQSDGP